MTDRKWETREVVLMPNFNFSATIVTEPFETVEYQTEDLVDNFRPGIFYEYVGVSFLDGFINLVKPFKVWLLERYTTQGPKYEAEVLEPFLAGPVHTKLYDLKDDVFILAETKQWWWAFWFDCDVSDCCVGRCARAYEEAAPVNLRSLQPDHPLDAENKARLEKKIRAERSMGHPNQKQPVWTREQVVAWAEKLLDSQIESAADTWKERRADPELDNNDEVGWEALTGRREIPVECLKGWVKF